MALRTNTVAYGFTTLTTGLNAGTRHEYSAITVRIDETSSRTIRSAYIEVTGRGTETAGTSATSRVLGVRIDAVAWSDTVVSETVTNTGDQQSFRWRLPFTSYFQTNFTGASHSVQAAIQIGNLPTINLSCKLVITYEYDDASATTRTKTAWIPIESPTGSLSATLTEIGTNQIPQLTSGGILPEASITIRDLFFIVMANEGNSGTTDFQLGLEIDSEGETLFGSLEQALDSSPWMEVIWKRTDLSTTAAHAFRARSTTASRLHQLCAIMVVTYSYDHSSSTSLFNSLLLPMPTSVGAFGGTTSGNQQQAEITILVEEPATVTLQQSAVFATYNVANLAITGLSIAVGGQTHRAYTPITAVNAPAGQHSVMHRFDSGGAAGSGLSLARGENTITLSWYRTSSANTAVGFGWSAMAILNYTSGKATAGSGAHTHTTLWMGQGSTATGTTGVLDYSAFAPTIPESSYWLTHVGYQLDLLHAGRGTFVVSAERIGSDQPSDGYEDVLVYSINSANELGLFTPAVAAHRLYARHPGDLDTKRFDLETSRGHRVTSYFDPVSVHCGWSSVVHVVTYHAIATTVTGAITGYAGDGSGITVTAYRTDTKEPLYQATSSAGGSYTFSAYSTALALYAEAREDATHVGRSNNFTPS